MTKSSNDKTKGSTQKNQPKGLDHKKETPIPKSNKKVDASLSMANQSKKEVKKEMNSPVKKEKVLKQI